MVSHWLEGAVVQTVVDLLLILVLVMLNGLFAYAEIAIVSAKKVRLQQLAKKKPSAQVALQLADDPTDFLSTVQVGITLIGILAGALSGATLAERLATWLVAVPLIGDYAEAVSFALVVVLVTYLSLTIGELTPKALALNNPERGAMLMARPLQFLSRLTLPIVRILSLSTERLLALLSVHEGDTVPVTEEELKALAAEGAEAGVLEPMEQRLVERALNLDDISLRPLVTHRTQVEWLDVTDPPATIRQIIAENEHTWFPLCDGGLDRVVGLVRARDLLLRLEEIGESEHGTAPAIDRALNEQLQSLAYPALFVPLTASPVKVLEMFRSHHAHVAFAVDEYGGIEGIVTPFDVLEALVGTLRGQEES